MSKGEPWFTRHISVGNLIQIAATIVMLTGAYYTMRGEQEKLSLRIANAEEHVSDLRKDVEARMGRVESRIEKRLDHMDTKLDRLLAVQTRN